MGRTIQLNAHPFTVVGVAPEGFNGSYAAYATDIWVPMMMHEQVRPRSVALSQRGWGWLRGTGRLKPGVTLEQARADLARLAQQLRQEFPKLNEGLGFEIYPAGVLPEEFRTGAAKFLGFFQGVVFLVLLVACANIASMLLAQAVGRRQEVAIRQALGATRERLVRQCLTENLLISGALLSGAAGLLVAMWAQSALLGLAPPLEELSTFSPNLGLDARALAFVFLLSLVAGLLFGALPALRAAGTDLVSALKEGASSTTGGRSRARLQRAFIVGQVAVSVLLLVTAGLLLRTLAEARAFNPGFNTQNVLVADVHLNRYGYDGARARAFYQQALERLQSMPAVRSVSFSTSVPLGGGQDVLGFRIPGHEPSPEKPLLSIDTNLVGPNYFSTMEIPLLRGRDFRPEDGQPSAPGVAIINQTMAQRFWPGADPLGERIQSGSAGPWLEIIGVARDIKYYSLAEEPRPFIYGSMAQFDSFGASLLVLTQGDPAAVLPAVREQLAALEPALATAMVISLDELRLNPLLPQRALAALTGLFAALALALSAIGLYGLLSYVVAQRRREIGLRLALGAQPRDILRLVIGQGLTLTAVGIGVGLAAAFALTRFLRALLFGVTPTDLVTLVAVSGLLAVVGLLACLLSAGAAGDARRPPGGAALRIGGTHGIPAPRSTLRGPHASPPTGLHPGRRPHSRSRDRRQYRPLQPGERRVAPPAALPRSRAPGGHLGLSRRRHERHQSGRFPRLARTNPRL